MKSDSNCGEFAIVEDSSEKNYKTTWGQFVPRHCRNSVNDKTFVTSEKKA